MEYRGSAVSRGIAIAPVFCFYDKQPEFQQRNIEESARETEKARYLGAIKTAREELESIYQQWLPIDAEKAAIFQAHIDLLSDEQITREIETAVLDEGKCAEWAVASVYATYAGILANVDDALIRERAADLKDVSCRLQRILVGDVSGRGLEDVPEGVLLAAHDLMPSQTATLNPDRVRGIVTETGGTTSHTAILARSFGIPAVLGIPGILTSLSDGSIAILDGTEGILLSDPTKKQVGEYEEKQKAFLKTQAKEREFLPREPVTRDGCRIEVHLNIGNSDVSRYKDFIPYVDGVGLFRSEFLFLSRDRLPSEEEQFDIYKKTLQAFGGKPVILRTLDIGGDKQTDCIQFPKEDNPFLGLRALRLCFQRHDIFRTQLRAAYRAGVYGNLWIMFPMVSSIDDIRKAKAFCRDVCAELEREGAAFSRDVKLGIMIETPAMAILADQAVKEVDFASLGTNDLCQYTLAVDRLNQEVASYYMPYHPAVLRLIGMAAEAFRLAGKPIGICGELGGDEKIVPVLIGLGIRKFSMNTAAVAVAKAAICSTDCKEARALAQRALEQTTENEIRELLKNI